MHHVVFPVTSILSAIVPAVGPRTLHPVLDEIAFKGATIVPSKAARPMLLPTLVLALVDRAVLPCLLAVAVVLVILPLARILRPIGMCVRPRPMHHIIFPEAEVDVSVYVNISPEAILCVI